MDVQTAKQEIRNLIETGKSIPTKAEKEAYMNSFLKELSSRNEESIRANFFALMETIKDLFSTVDDLLEKDKLSKDDKDWLEKELEEMENKLKAYKRKHVMKAS